MRRHIIMVALVAVLLSVGTARAEFKVEPDDQNVVASKLEGTWIVHAELTKRLKEPRQARKAGALIFKSDPEVAKTIPDRYEAFLKDKRIYMAGTVTLREKDHPFILIQHGGNAHVVWFRDKGEEKLGDTESFFVMLAGAQETQNDLLFVGGDFAKESFSAFERMAAKHTASKDVPEDLPQAVPVVNWFKAAQGKDLALLKEVFSERMRANFDGVWDKRMEIYQREFNREFGEGYNPADVQYRFEGDKAKDRGKVHVVFKGKKVGSLDVIREGDAWKVNEN